MLKTLHLKMTCRSNNRFFLLLPHRYWRKFKSRLTSRFRCGALVYDMSEAYRRHKRYSIRAELPSLCTKLDQYNDFMIKQGITVYQNFIRNHSKVPHPNYLIRVCEGLADRRHQELKTPWLLAKTRVNPNEGKYNRRGLAVDSEESAKPRRGIRKATERPVSEKIIWGKLL